MWKVWKILGNPPRHCMLVGQSKSDQGVHHTYIYIYIRVCVYLYMYVRDCMCIYLIDMMPKHKSCQKLVSVQLALFLFPSTQMNQLR